jgi:hypothetical protein
MLVYFRFESLEISVEVNWKYRNHIIDIIRLITLIKIEKKIVYRTYNNFYVK